MVLPRRQLEIEIKVGIFVTIGLGLVLALIIMLGGARSLLTSENHYTSHFDSSQGLISGAQVELNGIKVGLVESVVLDEKTEDVKVTILVDASYQQWIREDSRAEIATQGVLGDRYISLTRGSKEKKEIPPGGDIPATGASGFTQVINSSKDLIQSLMPLAKNLEEITYAWKKDGRADRLFEGLATTASNLASVSKKADHQLDGLKLKSAIGHLDGILEKVNKGKGSVGALINDPALYHDLQALVGGGSRNKIIRNLIRKTIRESEEKENQTRRENAGS